MTSLADQPTPRPMPFGNASEELLAFDAEPEFTVGATRPVAPQNTGAAVGLNRILSRVGDLGEAMSRQLKHAFSEIEQINLMTKILALNAQIEAARAGTVGQAFGVVAGEMANLSTRTTDTAGKLNTETRGSLDEMIQTIHSLGGEIRGTRLSDLAMTNIDLIDRNLYERSCDVRWWATDSSVVEALAAPSAASFEHASHRLGMILDAYTVYFDIVLCDLKGRVVANGRPGLYSCLGTEQSQAPWFRTALAHRDGSEFGFQSVHRNPALADGKHSLVYSCAVREGGSATGKPTGVLGVIFNWESLAQTIVNNTSLSAEEKPFTRVCIVDSQGLVLADSSNRLLAETLSLPNRPALFALKKGHVIDRYKGAPHLLAHAFSPGYETYATGWHSLILQKLELSR